MYDLSLNVCKTKELLLDFRKTHQQTTYTPLCIEGTPVGRVKDYKNLGVRLSDKHLYYLRQLRKFKVTHTVLTAFYTVAM